ncbi:MAG: hypothetical protein IJQ29_08145, partial [Synergistaceae bacterium]|nr:hypothetical protein [Synergistaceae bacterium]
AKPKARQKFFSGEAQGKAKNFSAAKLEARQKIFQRQSSRQDKKFFSGKARGKAKNFSAVKLEARQKIFRRKAQGKAKIFQQQSPRQGKKFFSGEARGKTKIFLTSLAVLKFFKIILIFMTEMFGT